MTEEKGMEAEFMAAMRSFSWKTLHDEAAITKAHDAIFAYVRHLKAEAGAFREAVEAASPYLQCGGPHHGLVPLGRCIIREGIPALCREIDRLKAEAERREKERYELD